MDKVAPVLVILVVGALVALQGPTNALVGRAAAAPVYGVLASLAVSTALVGAVALAWPVRPQPGALLALPWYAWLGGVYGAVILLGAVVAVPKLGAGPALVAALLAQTAFGLAIDHFGLFGLPPTPATPLKLGGLAVMVGGALMIAIKR